MMRDAQIPLFLWVATALLVHLLGGRGAEKAADWVEEGVELRRFAEGVRQYVRSSGAPLEISLEDEAPQPAEPQPPEPPSSTPDAAPEPNDDAQAADDQKKTTPPTAKPLPEPEKPLKVEEPEQKKAEEEQKKVEEKEALAAQELMLKKSIAVRQHVEDKQQADNPDADFISEHNNRVKEQTQSRLTSNDQNDPNPTPGSNASGAGEQPGDSHQTRIADSEDRVGEEARAPSDEPAAKRDKVTEQLPNAGAEQALRQAHAAPAQTGATSGTARPPDRAVPATPSPGSQGQAEQKAQAAAPDLLSSEQGTSTSALAQAEKQDQAARKAQQRRQLPRRKIRGYEDLLGLGAAGTTTSGINLNLTPGLARDAIGGDTLSRERLADGARRRSQHMGSWKSAGIERWRSAIENYVPSVKPGNQTALNSARSPFGTYLAVIHNRLHPIFADWFLASLDSLPRNDPLNNPELHTNLEIVLDADEGRIVKMGVTRASGVTAFDVNALSSVQRASPFGTPPREIVSPDGKVYLHWEFHRNPAIACTTFNARPFMLKGQQKTAPPVAPPVGPEPVPDGSERHGSRSVPHEPRMAVAQ